MLLLLGPDTWYVGVLMGPRPEGGRGALARGFHLDKLIHVSAPQALTRC